VVSWFGPQNQAGYGLSVASQNRQEDEDGVGHTLRSSGLLPLEVTKSGTRGTTSPRLGGKEQRALHESAHSA
jgi:hypothetical protein